MDCIHILINSDVSYNRKGNKNKHKNNQQQSYYISILYRFCVCGLGWSVASLDGGVKTKQQLRAWRSKDR